jgi:putative transposase
MKGRIFRYAKYKAWNQVGIITCRVNPKYTSRECARCGAQVIRYAQGQPEEGYQMGASLVICPDCKMRGHADRNASLKIGQRLMARSHKTPKQEKPGEKPPSMVSTGHGTGNGHGTAQKGKRRRMGQPSLSIPPQLRLPRE